MNERIRQLAEQANEAFSQQVGEHGSYYFNGFAEKFALLIVKECTEWVNDNVGLIDEEARADLLKHFGVKEYED